MALTNAQLVTLGNAIRANGAVNGDLTAYSVIAAWYNAEASPAFHVFRSSMSSMDTRSVLEYSELISGGNPITDVERWAFDTLTADTEWDASTPSNRQAIEDVFSGPQRATTRGQIQAAYVRLATEVEKLFAVNGVSPNGGNGGTATTAANAVFEGEVTIREVDLALEATA